VLADVPQVRDLRTPIVLDGLLCVSNESRLGECDHLPVVEDCTHSGDAGANCTVIIGWQHSVTTSPVTLKFPSFIECEDGDIQLVPREGDAENEGLIEYCSGGRWVVMCHDSWDTNDARVICRQLGFNVESKFNACKKF
jgi:deleted-in-malignant-brain-tumors protein 1